MWFRLKEFITGERIRGRVFRSFVLLTLLPVLLLGFSSYFIASTLIQARAGKDAVHLLRQVGRNLEREIAGITQFANLIFASEAVNNALATRHPTPAERFQYGTGALRFVEDYVRAGHGVELSSVVIAGFNGERFIYGDYIEVDPAWPDEEWYKRALAADGGIVWLGTHPNFARPPFAGEARVFSMVRILKDLRSFRPHGLLLISVKPGEFDRIFRDADVTGRATLTVFDREGRLLLSAGPIKKAAELFRVGMEEIPGEGYRTVFLAGRRHLVARVRLANTGWYILQAVPVEALTAEGNLIRNITLLTCLASLLILLVLSYRFADSLTRPLRELAATMRQVEQGDLKAGADAGGNDEIAWLAGRFNRMMAQIVKLFHEVEEEGRRKRQAELAALQAQINPHFLYNTLNGIRWLVMMGEDPTVVDAVITSLVKLLQNTIGSTEEFHTLAEEIELVKSYLVIQKMRYRDKFRVEYSLAPEVLSLPVPRLILQPLVENTIFHGLEPREGPGTIRIIAAKEDSFFRIEVSDDGVGIPPDVLARLFEEKSPPRAFSGIGLRNVRERLRLLYGSEHSLRVESTPGEGTRVIITLPEGGSPDVSASNRG